MKVTVGLVQMTMSEIPSENLKKALSMIGEAADKGADAVCLPELFMTHYFPQELGGNPPHWEEIPGEVTRSLSEAARRNNVVLVAGSLCEKAGTRFYNTSLVFDSDGRLLGKYRKMHLPNDECFLREELFFSGKSRI
jgi:predicted amidohydrolase